MTSFSKWLAQTPLSELIRGFDWVIPLIQTIHILSIAAIMASAALLNLRILGLALPSQPVAELGRRLIPATWIALAVLLVSGALLAIGEPERSLVNLTFQIKMVLVLCVAGLLAFLQRDIGKTDAAGPGLSSKVAAGVSLALWLAIIFAGRWIAYTGSDSTGL